jgi:hypothetical protein
MEQRYADRVGERLVLVVDEIGQTSNYVLVVENEFVVIGPERVGDRACLCQLVEAWLAGKGDRERS